MTRDGERRSICNNFCFFAIVDTDNSGNLTNKIKNNKTKREKNKKNENKF